MIGESEEMWNRKNWRIEEQNTKNQNYWRTGRLVEYQNSNFTILRQSS